MTSLHNDLLQREYTVRNELKILWKRGSDMPNHKQTIFRNSDVKERIIVPGQIVDPLIGTMAPRTALHIRDGQIFRIMKNYNIQEAPEQCEVISCPELTILPALVDCHVHLGLDGHDFEKAVNGWLDTEVWVNQVKESLENSLNCGIVILRDGGDNGTIGLQAKQLVENGELDGPRILACGQGIGKAGKYGSFLGPGVVNVTEAYQLIDRFKEQGADLVKVLLSGIVSFKNFGKVGPTQFTQTELNLIIEYAHEQGLPVMAHASSDEAVRLGIIAGVDSMEHGYFISTESMAMMAEKGIAWVPTVVPVANQLKSPSREAHSQEAQDIIKRTYELQLRRINEARTFGVLLGIGTDAGAGGVVHGYDYFRELELFSQAGLSAIEVLRAATINSSKICGVEARVGSIEVGKDAVLIGTSGNPMHEIEGLKIEFLLY